MIYVVLVRQLYKVEHIHGHGVSVLLRLFGKQISWYEASCTESDIWCGFGFLVRPKEGPELFGECGIAFVRIVVHSGLIWPMCVHFCCVSVDWWR